MSFLMYERMHCPNKDALMTNYQKRKKDKRKIKIQTKVHNSIL